jgi:methyl-accepting chemotaxis protein
MLAHFSIRARLVGAVLVLFLLTAGLGGFCYARLHALSTVTDALAGNALPSTRILGRLVTNFEALLELGTHSCLATGVTT